MSEPSSNVLPRAVMLCAGRGSYTEATLRSLPPSVRLRAESPR